MCKFSMLVLPARVRHWRGLMPPLLRLLLLLQPLYISPAVPSGVATPSLAGPLPARLPLEAHHVVLALRAEPPLQASPFAAPPVVHAATPALEAVGLLLADAPVSSLSAATPPWAPDLPAAVAPGAPPVAPTAIVVALPSGVSATPHSPSSSKVLSYSGVSASSSAPSPPRLSFAATLRKKVKSFQHSPHGGLS